MSTLNLQQRVKDVLYSNSQVWDKDVKDNLTRVYPNFDYMRNAKDTIRTDITETIGSATLVGYGRANFENTEEGIPPMAGRATQNRGVKELIYQWTFKIGMMFETDEARYFWSMKTRQRIYSLGTKLWQKGGRKDIYTNENDNTFNRISQQLDGVINDIKILS